MIRGEIGSLSHMIPFRNHEKNKTVVIRAGQLRALLVGRTVGRKKRRGPHLVPGGDELMS